MPYWVYVLRSKKTKRRYIGQTDNLELRMMRHNCGMVTSTAPYHPWQLIFQEKYSTRSETMQRERFLKSGKGREFLDSIEVELGWPKRVTYPANKTITYTYDAVGNRTAMTDPDGGITTYSYDAANRIAWLLNPFSEYTTFAYDSLGQRVTQQNGNGTWVSYTYDDAGRLTDQVHLKSDNSIFDSWSNEHDFVGNLIATTETNGDIITYTYDSAYQLTREYHVSAHPYDITYTYDAAGNRLTKVDSGSTTTYAYDVANQLETEETTSGITTFTFDANGNTYVENAGGDLTTYTWSIDNMCLGIALPNATLNTFVYDADLKRRQEEDSAGVAKFINDMDNVLLETNSGGTTQAAYTLEPQQYGNLLSQRRAGASHFHHFDVIGSTDSITNAAETKEVHYQSKAFGPTEVLSGSFTANRYLWNARVGYRWEPDAQEYDVRRRKYRASRGRWESRDPQFWEMNDYLLIMGRQFTYPKTQFSCFVYAGNNPVMRYDPSGLKSKQINPKEFPKVDCVSCRCLNPKQFDTVRGVSKGDPNYKCYKDVCDAFGKFCEWAMRQRDDLCGAQLGNWFTQWIQCRTTNNVLGLCKDTNQFYDWCIMGFAGGYREGGECCNECDRTVCCAITAPTLDSISRLAERQLIECMKQCPPCKKR